MEDLEERVDDNRDKNIPFEKVVEAFESSAGNMSLTAKKLNINRRTLQRWREKFPDLNSKMKDIEEGLIDLCETKLMQAINEGNLTAILFFLKTKGKSRGYIEGQFITGSINTNKSMSQEEAIDFIKSLENQY